MTGAPWQSRRDGGLGCVPCVRSFKGLDRPRRQSNRWPALISLRTSRKGGVSDRIETPPSYVNSGFLGCPQNISQFAAAVTS